MLLGIALVAASRDAVAAAHMLGAARALRDALHAHLTSREAKDEQTAAHLIRSRLGNAAFAQAIHTGASTAPSDVFTTAEELVARLITDHGSAKATFDGSGRELSTRELDVLRLVAEGLTDKEVGSELGITRRTVSKHVEMILAKLDVPSRTAAVTAANRKGFLS